MKTPVQIIAEGLCLTMKDGIRAHPWKPKDVRPIAKDFVRWLREGGYELRLDPAKQKPCKSILRCGPGHQSTKRCDKRGPHLQHGSEGFFWTGRKAYSGYFDELPEDEMSDREVRAERRAAKRKRK